MNSPSLLSVPNPIIMIAVIPNTINIVHNQAKNNLDLETLFNSILISDNIDFSSKNFVNINYTIQKALYILPVCKTQKTNILTVCIIDF